MARRLRQFKLLTKDDFAPMAAHISDMMDRIVVPENWTLPPPPEIPIVVRTVSAVLSGQVGIHILPSDDYIEWHAVVLKMLALATEQ